MVPLADNPFLLARRREILNFATMDPQQASQVYNQLRSLQDHSPTSQQQTSVLLASSLDTLTSGFDISRIPLSRLKQMMRDPMIQFALFFIRAQLMRARWKIKCDDPQVAAFVDRALREIYPSLVSQYMLKLVFGYQALVKRFQLSNPTWTYVDVNGTESPIWNQGNIQALTWKPFVNLPPEAVDPIWGTDGSFNGITYKPVATTGSAGASGQGQQEYTVLESLWFTNEKESVQGSLWGYPRIGYAYRFWWSFWFNWGLADRHFEKDADPPAIVYYPANKTDMIDIGGQRVSRRQMALNIGDSARSNSTIALPGDVVKDDQGKSTTIREWEITFPKGNTNFDAFAARFLQLQQMMLRAMMVPEEAFQAKGGTAGYNSTGQLQEAFVSSQIVLMQEFDFDLNRYVIPDILAANFQDLAVEATKVTSGLDVDDIDLVKIIIQGIANSDPSVLGLDYSSMLDSVGLPRLSSEALAQVQQQQNVAAQTAKPSESQAKPGEAGVTQQGLYYGAREVVKLSSPDDAETTFMAELTSVAALTDHEVMSNASRLRGVWRTALKYDFSVATNLLQDYGSKLDLDETFFERFFRRITNRAHDTAAQTRRVLMSVMRRAAIVELERAGIKDFSWDPAHSTLASTFLSERAGEMVTGISDTTRDQLRTYLSDLVSRDTPVAHMPHLVRAHFEMFSSWRADRIVRTEISNAYNMATLFAAQDAGVAQVQAIDAQLGPERSDPECIERNGRIFPISEAFSEQAKEHTNGTLQWRMLRKPVRVSSLPVPANVPTGVLAASDDSDKEVVVRFSEKLNERQRNNYLLAIVDNINAGAQPDELPVAA